MKMCPELCVAAVGHTDVRNSNAYNTLLSYNRAQAAIDHLVTNYGIDRSRLRLMYGGEETTIARGSKEGEHYMNRRVEFRVCEPGDNDMGRPDGGSAGSGDRGKSGGSFRGNKNSGY
jgi:outer membrane protein OmpA-like peptidoglycan-associated protein